MQRATMPSGSRHKDRAMMALETLVAGWPDMRHSPWHAIEISEYTNIRNMPDIPTNDALRLFKAELYKALGHPARLRIIDLLRDGERSVSELQAGTELEGSA